MFSEVGKIYARAFRMLFARPVFMYLTASYYLYSLIYYVLLKYIPLSLVTVSRLIDWVVDVIFSFGVPIVFILIVFRDEDIVRLKPMVVDARGYFWKYIGQSLVGTFLAILFTIPFFFVFLLIYLFEQNALTVLAWWFVVGYLGMGTIGLASRLLVDGGSGLFKNAMAGIRMLNGHFLFFATLYLVQIAIYLINLSVRLLIGSSITGVDLTSVSTSSLRTISEGLGLIMQTPIVLVYDLIVQPFLFPISAIVLTLAYLRYKNYASLARAIQQSASTDH